jgi:hypothetical protein
MGDANDWDDFLTSLGSPEQPSEEPEPCSPKKAEIRNEVERDEAKEPLPSRSTDAEQNNYGSIDAEAHCDVADSRPLGSVLQGPSRQLGDEESCAEGGFVAEPAGGRMSFVSTGHSSKNSMHSYDVEAVLAEVAALQQSGALENKDPVCGAENDPLHNEAEAREGRNAAEAFNVPPKPTSTQADVQPSNAAYNADFMHAAVVPANKTGDDHMVDTVAGAVSTQHEAQQTPQVQNKSEARTTSTEPAADSSRVELGGRDGAGRKKNETGGGPTASQVAGGLQPLQPPLSLSSLPGMTGVVESVRSEWSIADALEHNESLGERMHAHKQGKLSQQLEQELALSRRRNQGSWPERGRPDPVRRHCMLGGQLTLEVSSTTISSGRAECTCSCAASLGWDTTGSGQVIQAELIVLGYHSGDVDVLFNLQDGREPLAVQLPHRDREPLQPVACMALSPCNHMSPMWLLCVAHAGNEAKVRVLDITDLVARIQITSHESSAPMPLSEVGSLAANVIERSKKFNFPVIHVVPHYIRRTLPSAAAGCHLFVVAGPEPLSHNPKAPQLLLLACRGPTSIIGPKLTVEAIPVRVDITSVYTAFFEASGAPEVEPIRMSGTWRSIETMPLLQEPPGEQAAGQQLPATSSGEPDAGGAQAVGSKHSSADLLREVLAVVGMDDVHVCRIMHAKEHGNPVPFVRLSRLFSLRVSKGDWGGQACASWAPRASLLWHLFPSSTRGKPSHSLQQHSHHKLQCTRLAVSWGGTVSVYMVPYTVSLHPRPTRGSEASSTPPLSLYLQPDCTCTFKLAAGEVAAKLGWVTTGAPGAYKLIVLAVPEVASVQGEGVQPTRDIIIPTIYIYNPISGEREEVLELGAILPETSRMFRWLSTMNNSLCDGLNALGQALSVEVGAHRGMQTGAPWPPVHSLPSADPFYIDSFHMLCDIKLVGLLPLDGSHAGRVVLHQARRMSWQSQADVLESIASVAPDKLAKWELALLITCEHHLGDVLSSPGNSSWRPHPAIVQRIGHQLLQMASALRCQSMAAAQVKGLPDPVDWTPLSEEACVPFSLSAAALLQHRAAFVATIALLVLSASCVQLSAPYDETETVVTYCHSRPDVSHLFDTFVSIYHELCLGGFRPVTVLRFSEIIMAGVPAQLPPQFLDDVATLCLGPAWSRSLSSNNLASSGQDSATTISSPDRQSRMDWLELLFLHLDDAASLDPRTLLRICHKGLMCTAIVHTGHLLRQPLLPVQSMLVSAASTEEQLSGAANKARCFLAVYVASCLAMEPAVTGRFRAEGKPLRSSLADRQALQMTMLALVLWADATFFERLVAPEKLKGLHEMYPLLHLLLQQDTAYVIGMFDGLPVLREGIHCGSDDMRAVVASYGLQELCQLAPHAVTSLRQSVMTAFAALLSSDSTKLSDHPCIQVGDLHTADAATAVHLREGAVQMLMFMGRHIQRTPPAVLPTHCVVSCMLSLCKPWVPDKPCEREKLLSVFVDAFDPLEQPMSGSTSNGVGGSGGERYDSIQLLQAALHEKGLFKVSAKLEWRIGNVAAYLQSLWRLCELVGECYSRLQWFQAHPLLKEEISQEHTGEFSDIRAVLLRCAPECMSSSESLDAKSVPQVLEAVKFKAAYLVSEWIKITRDLLQEQQNNQPNANAKAAKGVLLQRFVGVSQLEGLLERGHESEPQNEGRVSGLTALLLETLDTSEVMVILHDESWRAFGEEKRLFELLAYILKTAQDSSSGLQARCLVLLEEHSTFFLFAQLCCQFWEAGVVQLLRAVKAPLSDELHPFLHDHCSFEASALLHSERGRMDAAVHNAQLHVRVAFLELRSFATCLLASLKCNSSCTGLHACVADDVLHKVFGCSSKVQPHEHILPELQDRVRQGQKLRENVSSAVSGLTGYWNMLESSGSDSGAGVPRGHVRWLLLCVLSEVAWGVVREGKGDVCEECIAGVDRHASRVLGIAWQQTVWDLADEVVRTCVPQGDDGIAVLEDVMEELAQAPGGGRDHFWGQETQIWTEITGRPAAPARMRGMAEEVSALETCARSKHTCWLVSLRYLARILSTQRTLRRVCESLNAVMTKDFFDVESRWNQEMHQPRLLQAEEMM